MATSYIPAKDADFDSWLNNFSTLLTASPTTYGLLAGDATAVAAQYTTWHAAYLAATNPATKTSVTVAAKDAARASAEAIVRPLAVRISQNAGVTNGNKTAIGVTVRVTVPTPVPPPITTPDLALRAAVPFNLQVSYRDTSTPTSKAKPPGATGIEIRYAVGTVAAVDPDTAPFYALWTKSPNQLGFASGQVGKVCTMWGRWFTRSGPAGQVQYGPFSTALVSTII